MADNTLNIPMLFSTFKYISMSDMDDEQKNFPKQKLKPVSNEGKRKPLSLKGNQQHRREVMTNMSKSMKLKLEKSTTRITVELSADEVFGKMIAAEIKQVPGNVKPLAKTKMVLLSSTKCIVIKGQCINLFLQQLPCLYPLHKNIFQLPV